MQNERALKVLSKYFPYGLRVTHTDDLTVDTPVRDLTKEYVVTAAANRYPLEKVLPILRPLDELTRPVTYRGKTIIPAEELAKLAVDLLDDVHNRVRVTETASGVVTVEVYWSEEGNFYTVYLWRDGFSNNDPEFIAVSLDDTDIPAKNILYILDLLYELQFAVGLAESEYRPLPVEVG